MARVDMKWGGVYGSGSKKGCEGPEAGDGGKLAKGGGRGFRYNFDVTLLFSK